MKLFLLLAVSLVTTVGSRAATFTVSSPTQVALSPALRDIQNIEGQQGNQVHSHAILPRQRTAAPIQADPALQTSPGPLISATPGAVFDGVSADRNAPPDTNMAVGQNPAYNYIFQTVNSRYAIYTKAGALVLGPNSLSSLWSALGPQNGCAVNNGGDVIAQYDKAADRWLITQLGAFTAPYTECIAVSKTPDPTGAYTLYTYSFGSTLNDYPKFSIWPTASNSAYLATYNLFTNGTTFAGGELCAYDRAKMLAGDPTAQSICKTISNDGGYMPADLDGSRPPVDGTPAYFLNLETLSSLRMYTLTPNFTLPAASTLSLPQDIAVGSFSEACAGGTCIPQLGTTQELDSLGDRLMYRLAFRNFGDHEAMVINHTVGSGSAVGVRWYELRAPVSSSGLFSLFQQGTFAPDATYRWMGSAAMDSAGDIGLGYSASSSSIHPAIRYTGRVPGDPLGTMGTEASLTAGTGSQTASLSRWGDYTALRIDPVDDCTFWYTNEYLTVDGTYNWHTSIGSFKFGACAVAPAFAISSSPVSQTVTAGTSTTYSITVTASGGFTGPVTLSASGLPAGASASFNPSSVTTSGSSTMTVTTSSTTPTGSYALTITGSSGSLTRTTTATLVVNAAPAPDFSLSAAPASQSVPQGNAAGYTLTITPAGGFTGSVTFSVSGLPPGSSATFNPTTVSGSGSSVMTVSTSATTPAGSYPLTITATSGSLVHSAPVTLIVTAAGAANTATFVNADTTTQGTWKGTYGVDGYAIPNDSTNYPAYAHVTMWSSNPYTWNASTTDVRALQKAAAADRIASTWFGGTFFIDVNLTDGLRHQLAIYALDWDGLNRSERIDVLDAVSGAVLDTRTLTAFKNGQYLSWTLGGHVQLRVTLTGGENAVVSGLFFGAPAAVTPGFAISASPASQSVTAGSAVSYNVNITASGGFTGSSSLSVSGLPSGAAAAFNPTTVSGSGSSVMTVSTGAATAAGTYPLTITATSGSTVHSAQVSLTVTAASTVNTATFVNADFATQGTWKGTYGAEGYAITNDVTNYPAYAQVTMWSSNPYTWNPSTTDVRALQKAAATDRIASTWFGGTFVIDINLTDGLRHQLALYALDWDGLNRSERIDVLDAVSGAVLDTRTLTAFKNGQYLIWTLGGHVQLRVTLTGGDNAVVNGLFFGAPAAVAPGFAISASPTSQSVTAGSAVSYNVNITASGGFAGTTTLSATGLPTGASAAFNPPTVSGSGSSVMTVTTGAATPAGSYALTITATSGSIVHSVPVTLTVTAAAAANSATYVKTDTTTQGTWKGIYGADGYAVTNDATNYPAYAQVTMWSSNPYTWNASTTDVRALQKAAATDRIASTWFGGTFTIDVNLTDGLRHQLAIYALDWDGLNRSERIDVLDAASGAVLDTRTLTAFRNGQYLVWTLSGHVQLRVTLTGGENSVVSGLFFGPA